MTMLKRPKTALGLVRSDGVRGTINTRRSGGQNNLSKSSIIAHAKQGASSVTDTFTKQAEQEESWWFCAIPSTSGAAGP